MFMRNYSLIIAPLEKLPKKFEGFTWNDECDVAFKVLKEKLTSALILVYVDWNKQFHVNINALWVTLGAILAYLEMVIWTTQFISPIENFPL